MAHCRHHNSTSPIFEIVFSLNLSLSLRFLVISHLQDTLYIFLDLNKNLRFLDFLDLKLKRMSNLIPKTVCNEISHYGTVICKYYAGFLEFLDFNRYWHL